MGNTGGRNMLRAFREDDILNVFCLIKGHTGWILYNLLIKKLINRTLSCSPGLVSTE
jgi:hypothetical protein